MVYYLVLWKTSSSPSWIDVSTSFNYSATRFIHIFSLIRKVSKFFKSDWAVNLGEYMKKVGRTFGENWNSECTILYSNLGKVRYFLRKIALRKWSRISYCVRKTRKMRKIDLVCSLMESQYTTNSRFINYFRI